MVLFMVLVFLIVQGTLLTYDNGAGSNKNATYGSGTGLYNSIVMLTILVRLVVVVLVQLNVLFMIMVPLHMIGLLKVMVPAQVIVLIMVQIQILY